MSINLPDNAFDDGFDPLKDQGHDDKVSYTNFGMICWVNVAVDRFQKGERLEYPNVTRAKFEKGQEPVDTGEQFYMPAMKINPKSPDRLYTLILKETNQSDQEFFNVLDFHNWNSNARKVLLDGNGNPVESENGYKVYENIINDDGEYVLERNAFVDFQVNELAKFKTENPDTYAKLQATGKALFTGKGQAFLYAQYSKLDTGYTTAREVQKYVKDLVIFDTKEEWEKAKAEVGNSSTNSSAHTDYPASWQQAPDGLKTLYNQLNDANMSQADIAKNCQLVLNVEGNQCKPGEEPTQAAPAINGDRVKVKELMAELENVPVDSIKLPESWAFLEA